MKTSELIKKLELAVEKHGDLEVEITDRVSARFYAGEFSVQEFEGIIDIGVGYCEIVE